MGVVLHVYHRDSWIATLTEIVLERVQLGERRSTYFRGNLEAHRRANLDQSSRTSLKSLATRQQIEVRQQVKVFNR